MAEWFKYGIYKVKRRQMIDPDRRRLGTLTFYD